MTPIRSHFTQQESGDQHNTVLSVVASLDAKGKLVNDTINRLTISIPQAQAAAIPTGFSKLHLQTIVPPHATAVRIIIRDSSGRIGTADVPAGEVPHLAISHLPAKETGKRPF